MKIFRAFYIYTNVSKLEELKHISKHRLYFHVIIHFFPECNEIFFIKSNIYKKKPIEPIQKLKKKKN